MLAAEVTLDFEAARLLSPKRKSTEAENLEQLADEQLTHFGLEKDSDAIVEHFKAYGISTFKKRAKSIQSRRKSVEKHFE